MCGGACEHPVLSRRGAGHTAAWVVFCVSQAHDVEARIVEELLSLDLLATRARPAPRAMQWEDTGKLAYLNNVIKVPCCAEGRGRSVGRPPAHFAVTGLHALDWKCATQTLAALSPAAVAWHTCKAMGVFQRH